MQERQYVSNPRRLRQDFDWSDAHMRKVYVLHNRVDLIFSEPRTTKLLQRLSTSITRHLQWSDGAKQLCQAVRRHLCVSVVMS